MVGSKSMSKLYQRIGLVILSSLLFSMCVDAADPVNVKYYRYKDENGQTILANQIPPDQVDRGYEIINKSGDLQEIVPPALTPEERAAKAAEDAQKEHDKRLVGLYSSYAEIDQARDFQVGKIKSAQIIIQGNIKSLTQRRENTQAMAAELERNGKKVPETVGAELLTIDGKIKSEMKKLDDQKKLEKEMSDQFAVDRARLGELLNLEGASSSAQNSPAPAKP